MVALYTVDVLVTVASHIGYERERVLDVKEQLRPMRLVDKHEVSRPIPQ